MFLVASDALVDLRGIPIGLRCPAVHVVFFHCLQLQCSLRVRAASQHQALFGGVNIKPGECGVALHGALFIVERRARNIRFKCFTLAKQTPLVEAGNLLADTDCKFRKVVAAQVEGVTGVDGHVAQTRRELWIGQLRGRNGLLRLGIDQCCATIQQGLIRHGETLRFVKG